MHRIAEESLPLERLVVDLELAKEMFSDSIHKKKQIPSIAKNSPSGKDVQKEISFFSYQSRETCEISSTFFALIILLQNINSLNIIQVLIGD